MQPGSSKRSEDLISRISELEAEIRKLKQRKKYGLVWEEKPEKVVEDCKENLPVLDEVVERAVEINSENVTNLLIEGDNYHALSVLNYTHAGKIDVIYIDPPYNTGAKNWKYNNDFVDLNDRYRHSKWLSMMHSRLLLAKNLLKDDGVLICAIDENEHSHLGVLLQDLFVDREVHSITIVHNPRGIQGRNFSYTHEYAYFVFTKEKKVIGNRKIKDEDVDWRNLRDNGGESLRTDAKNCFYPVIIKNDQIVDFGDVPKDNFHPGKQCVQENGFTSVYPIDPQGIERKWRYARQSVESIKHLLRVKKTKGGSYEIELGKNFGVVRTVWQDSRYDANEYGTKLIKRIAPDSNFDFPKSLYSVYDCIAPIISDKKNAIVLDYFAGSGTTGHAVLELNKEDGGNRQFILCTNNENGIAEEVTYPRVKNVIQGYGDEAGIPANLRYFKTAFVQKSKASDDTRRELIKKSTEMICIKEGVFKKVCDNKRFKIYKDAKHVTGILFDLDSILEFKEKITQVSMPSNLYIFSLTQDTFDEDFADLRIKHALCAIPESVLEVYRKLFV